MYIGFNYTTFLRIWQYIDRIFSLKAQKAQLKAVLFVAMSHRFCYSTPMMLLMSSEHCLSFSAFNDL